MFKKILETLVVKGDDEIKPATLLTLRHFTNILLTFYYGFMFLLEVEMKFSWKDSTIYYPFTVKIQ